jgi:hypothetical protein
MTEHERDQFHKLTNQPELADLTPRKTQPISTPVFIGVVLTVLALVGGGVLALVFESWKTFGVSVIVALGALIISAAIGARKP